MMIQRSIAFVCLLALMPTAGAVAQEEITATALVSAQTAILKGTVIDSASGEILPSANVVVTSGAFKTGAITSLTGRFEIKGLRPGTYMVMVSYVGFTEKVFRDVVLHFGETQSLDISLQSTEIRLNPIVVSASRRPERFIETPAAVSVLEKEQIEARPVLSPAEHLKGLPGVDIASTGLNQDRPVVRGFNGDFTWRLLVLTDYRIANLPGLRGSLMQFIPSTNEDIERIEILYGPASAIYGPNAAGGVMHMITKSPFDSKGTTVSAGMGERDLFTGSFRHAGTLNDRIGYKISARYYRGHDWESFDPAEPDSIVKGIQTPNGRFDQGGKLSNERDFDIEKISGDARVDFRASTGATAILSGGFSRVSNLIFAAGTGALQSENWTTGYVQGRFVYRDLFAQAFFNKSDAGYTFALRTGDLFVDNSFQFVSQIQHGLTVMGGRQRLLYGVDMVLTRPKTQGTLHGRNEDKDNVNETGYYLQSETELSSKFKLVGALRFDDQNHLPDPVFSPRAALIFRRGANHNFRFTFNRAFDTPRPADLFGDVLISRSFGGLPYGIRVRMSSPNSPLTFRRDANGGIDGLYMQSPFNPESSGGRSTDIPADATRMWGAVVTLMKARGVDLSDLPPPEPEQVATVLKILNLFTRAFDPVSPQRVSDFTPAQTSENHNLRNRLQRCHQEKPASYSQCLPRKRRRFLWGYFYGIAQCLF